MVSHKLHRFTQAQMAQRTPHQMALKIQECPECPENWNQDTLPMIWYQFRKPYFPAKISFSRHQDGMNTAEDSTIIDFRFVGVKAFKGKNCTDVYNWKSICHRRGVSVNQAHECHVPTKGESLDVGGPFQCLGLRIIDVSGARKAVALNGIKIWIWN